MTTDELQQQLSALEEARLKLLTGERVVEVLELNPGLADQPIPLPAGLVIELPDPAPCVQPVKDVVSDVWG